MNKEIYDPYGFIYITTNMFNGVRYIGQKMFKHDYKTYLGSGKHFIRAVNKYGRENFSREIIAIAYSKEELDMLEIDFIKNFDAVYSDDYYNIADGGTRGNSLAGKTKEELEQIVKKTTHFGTNNGRSVKVICLTTGKIFNYIKDGAKYYNIKSYGHISSCCNGNRRSAGLDLVSGKKLIWMYYEDYLKKDKELVKDTLNIGLNTKKANVGVICLTTNKSFDTITDAGNYYKLSPSNITICCKGKIKTCGKLHDGTRLKWMYLDEYKKMNIINKAS